MLPLPEIGPKYWRIQNGRYPKPYFLWHCISFDNYSTKVSNTSIPMFLACWTQWNTQKVTTVNISIIKSKMAAKISFFASFAIHTRNFTDLNQWVPQHVTHWSFSHLLLFNTRGLCRLLHHRPPTSSQLFINRTSREVDRDWSAVFKHKFARTWESVHALRTIQVRGYPRESSFNFIFEAAPWQDINSRF